MGKPAGIRTARKHVKNRRNQVWADKDYKKAHLGTRWKANPFGGASHAKVCWRLLSEFEQHWNVCDCRELSWRRLVLRLSSPTLPSVSASECSSSRTARRSPPSSPTTVASTSSRRTTRFLSLDLVVRVTPWETFPESDSRSARWPMFPSTLCSGARKRDHVLKRLPFEIVSI